MSEEKEFKKISLDDLNKVSGGETDYRGWVCKFCGCDMYYHDHGDMCVQCGRVWTPVAPS